MRDMNTFIPEELEPDMLADLREEISDLYESSLQNLVELELCPDDKEMQRALFRSVHTIKGDLGLVGFLPMIEVLQYLEDVLDMMRKGDIEYSSGLHDLVVRLLDVVATFVEECVNSGQAEYDKNAVDRISTIIKMISKDNHAEHTILLKKALGAFSSHDNTEEPQSVPLRCEIGKTGVPKNITAEQHTDILFFRELMRPIEKRAGFIEGRADKIAALASYINSLSNTPIDDAQLAVACYTHDFGMAFLPEKIINNKAKLSDMEHNLIRSHVYKSTRLLENMTIWDEARKIIMQHHERADGSGFPLGLKGNDICDGANLLAIVETYINLTQPDHPENTPQSEVDAVITINKQFKGNFSTKWLRLFNQGMTEVLKNAND